MGMNNLPIVAARPD